jgi:hypothetical protein
LEMKVKNVSKHWMCPEPDVLEFSHHPVTL